MPYTSEQMCVDDIDAAREAVRTAEIAYRKGGSVNAVNKANKRLADAHQAQYECAGGIIPTR